MPEFLNCHRCAQQPYHDPVQIESPNAPTLTDMTAASMAQLVARLAAVLNQVCSNLGVGMPLKGVSSFASSLITFAGRSAHLAYRVHKSGRKPSNVI